MEMNTPMLRKRKIFQEEDRGLMDRCKEAYLGRYPHVVAHRIGERAEVDRMELSRFCSAVTNPQTSQRMLTGRGKGTLKLSGTHTRRTFVKMYSCIAASWIRTEPPPISTPFNTRS